MANKFSRSISTGNTVLGERATIVASQAKRAQEDLVRELEGKRDDLKMDIIKMTDVSPDNTQSLKPTGLAADDPKQWVAKLHKAQVELALLEQELKIAQATLKEWFTEEEAPTL